MTKKWSSEGVPTCLQALTGKCCNVLAAFEIMHQPEIKFVFGMVPKAKQSVTMWRPGESIIIHNIYIYIWAISKTLGSRNGHPQIWKGAIVYHPFAQKWYMANLRGIACRKNCCNDLPDSGAEAVLPSWSGIFAAGLWAIWGGATGRGALQISFSPPSAWTASLWASHLYTATL